MTLKRAGTALDEWRRGISLPTEAESATRAPEIVVLVESADGEAPGPAHLAAEVVGAIIRRTGAAVAANAALDVVGEVELLATATAIRQAVARADLVICLGGSRSYFSPNAFRLAAIAMGSGRPVIGNSSIFWYFEGTPPPFVCDDPVVLRARRTPCRAIPHPQRLLMAARLALPALLSHSDTSGRGDDMADNGTIYLITAYRHNHLNAASRSIHDF